MRPLSLLLTSALALILAVACASRATPPRVTATPEPPPGGRGDSEAAAEQPFPAFAVYTDHETLLVPLGVERPPARAKGHWVTTNEAPQRVVHYDVPDEPEVMGLRSCPCTAIVGACLNVAVQRTIDVAAGFSIEWSRDCSCHGHAGVEASNPTPEPTHPQYRSDGHDPNAVPCDIPDPPGAVTSVVSGTLYLTDGGSSLEDQCGNSGGLNIYNVWSEEVRLVDGPRAPSAPPVPWQLCDLNNFELQSIFVGQPEGTLEEEAPEEICDGDCDEPCQEEEDLSYPVLRNGRLCWRGEMMGPVGQTAYWAACVPLTAESCPSPLDPCGAAAPFASQLFDFEAWWVSTDSRFALSTAPEGLVVLGRDEATPVAVTMEVPIYEDEIVGVLYFENAASLAAAMEHDYRLEPEPSTEGLACGAGDECAGGALCDELDGVCRPPCQSDSECSWRGRCGARCHEDGRCGPEPRGQCDDVEDPCEESFFCVSGVCSSCRSVQDCLEGVCEEGRCERECWSDNNCDGVPCRNGRCERAEVAPLSCEEGLTAAQLGERCWRALGAERWAEAERLCRCGLAASPQPRVQGALFYNLGRVFEGRGEVEEARAAYQRSLDTRGENAEVRRRLEALSAP